MQACSLNTDGLAVASPVLNDGSVYTHGLGLTS